MKERQEFSEFAKKQLKQMKMVMDELEVQVALGKAEFKETFEKEREKFDKFIEKQKEYLKGEGKNNEENRKALAAALTNLQKQLKRELAQAGDAFQSVQNEMLRSVFETEAAIQENQNHLDFLLRQALDTFKSQLDKFRLQLGLATPDKAADLKDLQNKLKARVEALLDRLEKRNQQEEKIEQFMDDMNASFNHLKKAFTELFS